MGVNHSQRLERRRRMSEAVAGGAEAGAVAESFRVSINTVRTACREFGTTIPRLTSGRPARAFEVLAEMFRCDNHKEISERLGVSPQRVHQVYKLAVGYGVPVPPPNGRSARAS